MKFKRIFFSLLFLMLLHSCGSSVDDRDSIRSQYGKPDKVETRGSDPLWREFWTYREEGLVFEFRRSAPKCGGGRDVYLYWTYSYAGKGSLENKDLSRDSESKISPFAP